MENKATVKEILKTRWLLLLAYFFQLVVPFIVIFCIILESKELTHFKLSAGVFICGIAYICFASRIVKEKIRKLKEGTAKVIWSKIDNLVPLIVVALLVYLVETCLKGFDFVFYACIASVVLGSILEVFEYIINKKFIYEQKVLSLAKEQADIEIVKEKLKEEAKEF